MGQVLHAIYLLWQQLSKPLKWFLIIWAIVAGSLHFSFLILILQVNLLQLTVLQQFKDGGLSLKQQLHELHLTRQQWLQTTLGFIVSSCLLYDSLYFLSDTVLWHFPQLTTILAKRPFPMTYVMTAMLLMLIFCISQLPCFLHQLSASELDARAALLPLKNRQKRAALVLCYACFMLVMMFMQLQNIESFSLTICIESIFLIYMTWKSIKKSQLVLSIV